MNLTIDPKSEAPTFTALESIPDAVLFPIERIDPQKDQPRTEFDQTIVEAIAKSIKDGAGKRVAGTGIIQPLLVRWKPGAFDAQGNIKPDARVEIVAGETRYWASLTAGLEKLPVIITDMTSEEAYEDAVVENLLRGDLSDKDEGRLFLHLMNKHKVSCLGLAKRLYNDRSREGYIQSRVDLQRLNDIVRPMIDKRPDTMTAARRIQTIKNEDTQRELVEFMLGGGTFPELNEKIREIKGIVPSNKDDTESRKAMKKAFPDAAKTGSDSNQNDSEEADAEGTDGSEENQGDQSQNGQHQSHSTDEAATDTTTTGKNSRVMSRVNVGEALDRINFEMANLTDALEPVVLPLSTRRSYAEKIVEMANHYAKIQSAHQIEGKTPL